MSPIFDSKSACIFRYRVPLCPTPTMIFYREMGEADSWLETANFTSDGVDNCSAYSQGASSYSFQCEQNTLDADSDLEMDFFRRWPQPNLKHHKPASIPQVYISTKAPIHKK